MKKLWICRRPGCNFFAWGWDALMKHYGDHLKVESASSGHNTSRTNQEGKEGSRGCSAD